MYSLGDTRRKFLSDYGAAALGPAERLVAIVPNDATDLPGGACRSLWVGTSGTATLVFVDGTEAANVPLLAGLNPFAVKQVKTGGSALDIWAIY